MSLLQSIFAPNIDSAVGSLNKALTKLQKAETMHSDSAAFHAEQADMHFDLEQEQLEAADRAARIRNRLEDLLS